MAQAITISIHWQQDEPDGTECSVCGDACYLAQWRAWFRSSSLSYGQPLEIVLCGSCHDAIGD